LSERRLPALDLVRGTAAIAVAVPHFFIFQHVWPDTFEAISILGVEVFFVLSGYVLAPQIAFCIVERSGWINPGIFLVRRWMRTVPPYLLALVLISAMTHELFSLDFLRYAFYFQNLFQQHNINDYFSIAWSLSVEEWFYLLFPPFLFVITAALRRRSVMSAAIGGVIFIMLISTIRTVYGDYAQWGPQVRRVVIFRLDSIAYGFLLNLAVHRGPWLQRLSAPILAAGLAFACAAGFFLTAAIGSTESRTLEDLFPLLAGLIGVLGILLALRMNPAFERWPILSNVALFLGRISYSVYLFHLIVLIALVARIGFLPWPALLAIYLAATMALAVLVFHAIEAPILAARPKFRRAPASNAAMLAEQSGIA
jgi:peptidoglycan/LPS O-acetylase OafA/YrhL